MATNSTPIYTAKSTIRSIKNFSKGYTDVQAKVRTATSNDPWGPSGTQMNELARATFNQQEFLEIMEILDKRMNDKGKNWRHVFKALTVLDYLLHVGSENVVRYARENLYVVKTLKEFQFIDEEGKDQGSNVRQKAKDITALLSDEARLKEERRSRTAMRDRMSGRAPGDDRYDATTPVYERPGAGDDDRNLQKALEESRRMAREAQGDSSDDDLKKALELSKKEEQDRLKNMEKYNKLSTTEDWEGKSGSPAKDRNNEDFFGNDFGDNFGSGNNNNNNPDAFSNMNNFGGNSFVQSQPTGFNNPYLQFQQQQQQQMLQQQLEQEQQQQQQLMQQQLLQQQYQQQQQQMAFLNTMNNPYQQQLMPQMTGAPAIGSNNPFSANNIQKSQANQPFPDSFHTTSSSLNQLNNNSNGLSSNSNGFNANSNGFNTNSNSINNSNSLGDLAFLQTAMSNPAPAASRPAETKAPNAHDEKYAHLAMALSNREDGMDTFGNTGQLRIPSHHVQGAPVALTSHITGAANPFQRSNLGGMGTSNSLIDIGGNSNNNPFQSSSQAAGFGSSGFFNSNSNGMNVSGTSNGTFNNNTLF